MKAWFTKPTDDMLVHQAPSYSSTAGQTVSGDSPRVLGAPPLAIAGTWLRPRNLVQHAPNNRPTEPHQIEPRNLFVKHQHRENYLLSLHNGLLRESEPQIVLRFTVLLRVHRHFPSECQASPTQNENPGNERVLVILRALGGDRMLETIEHVGNPRRSRQFGPPAPRIISVQAVRQDAIGRLITLKTRSTWPLPVSCGTLPRANGETSSPAQPPLPFRTRPSSSYS